jgi:hypothetical protein
MAAAIEKLEEVPRRKEKSINTGADAVSSRQRYW